MVNDVLEVGYSIDNIDDVRCRRLRIFFLEFRSKGYFIGLIFSGGGKIGVALSNTETTEFLHVFNGMEAVLCWVYY